MRRILTFALLAAFALAASVPVSIVIAGKAVAQGTGGTGGTGGVGGRGGNAHGGNVRPG